MSTPTLETIYTDTATNELEANAITQPDDIHTAITPNDIALLDSHAVESEPHTHMDSEADNSKQEINYKSHTCNTCDVTQARDVPAEDKNALYIASPIPVYKTSSPDSGYLQQTTPSSNVADDEISNYSYHTFFSSSINFDLVPCELPQTLIHVSKL